MDCIKGMNKTHPKTVTVEEGGNYETVIIVCSLYFSSKTTKTGHIRCIRGEGHSHMKVTCECHQAPQM